MRIAVRSALTTLLTASLLATTVVPVHATEEGLLVEGETTTVALPEGAEAEFTPSDGSANGATVDAEPVQVDGATAQTQDGEVFPLGDGVSLVATLPDGEDVAVFEHDVTITPATEDTPAHVSEFVPGIELTFPVDPAELEGMDLASLGVWSRDNPEDEWEWVPSAYDPELGAVVAHSDHLSEFVVMGEPAASASSSSSATLPRIAIDPDNDVGYGIWNGRREGELEYSYAVARMVEDYLESTCQADVLITRNANTRFISPSIRAQRVQNHDADISVTLAFNAANIQGEGVPWGVYGDGGLVTYAQHGRTADRYFANRFNNIIPGWTTRPNERGPLRGSSYLLPYNEFDNVSGVHAHAELLFINHNYDWVIIRDHLDWVAAGVAEALLAQVDAMSGVECATPVTLPEPPTQEQIDAARQLGQNNYQIYGTDPVNLATGNFVAAEDVFRLPGVGDQVVDLTLAYNSLDARQSPVGRGWNFAYSSRAQQYDNGAVSVILADGRTVFFESDGSGGFVTPPGARTTLAATEGGALLRFGDNTTLEFAFDEETGYGTLVEAVDRQGNAYTLAYGPLAEAAEGEVVFAPLTSITDEAGQTVAVASTPEGRITAFTHPDGRVWTLAFDAAGNLTSVVDGANRTRSFTYDADGRLTTVTGADGVVELTNVYDGENRVVQQTDGAGYVRTIAYDEFNVTRLTDALGHTSELQHNDQNQLVSARDAEGGLTQHGYDEHYNPVSSTDANGNVYTSEFDVYGRVTSYTNPLGSETTYGYNTFGDLVEITSPDPNGGISTTRFVLNADGRAVETHLPDGTVTYATYDGHGDTLSITDGSGEVTTFAYDARGNRVSTTDALGHTTARTFDLANRVTSWTDQAGNTWAYAYDAADNQTSVTDPMGGVTTWVYDVNDSLISETNPRGDTWTHEYNVNLQLTATNRPDGGRIEYAYDAEHRLVAQVNPDGTRVAWERDGLGRVTATIDEAGNRWLTEYDAVGNAIAETDPNGGVRSLTVDPMNRPVTFTDELGHTHTVAYNPAGLVASETDELGRTVSYGYSQMGKLTSVTTPDGTTRTFTHDSNGRVSTVTDARGNVETYTVDALGRTVLVVDALGNEWRTEYDSRGNVVAAVDPLGNRTTSEFDALNRPVANVDALGNRSTYDLDSTGGLVGVTNANGNTTTFVRDGLSRVTSTTYPDGSTASLTYDLMGRVVAETDVRGESVAYVYDARGLVTAYVDEAGERWTTEYDVRGLPVATVDPLGARVTVEYDAWGRAVATVDAVGARTAYAYDAAGQLTATTNALGDTTTYGYDPMGRLTSVQTPELATTTYGYDANGNTTSVTNALGDTIAYAYDSGDRLATTTYPDGGVETLGRDAMGRTTSVTDPRGNTASFTYDALGRRTSATDAAGFVETYTYDAVGNRTSVTDARGGVSTFAFDSLNRLVGSVNAELETAAYAYDAAGNVTAITDAAGVVKTHAYDARGFMVETVENWISGAAPGPDVNVTTIIAYDAAGRVSATVDPRGNATTFVRDAAGRVTAETDALGQTNVVAFDALGRPATVTAPDGSITATTYSPDGYATAVAFPDQTVTYTFDARGNRTSMTDALGTSTWEYDWASRAIRTVDALGQENTYAYDLNGNEVRAQYADGRVVERTFDARDRQATQTDASGVTAFSYDAAGDLAGIVRASGVETAIERDLVGRITSIVHSGEGVVGNPLPSGEVNPSSMAPGYAFGHCKDNGNGHPNQQPAGCSTDTLAFGYEYDARGFVSQREVGSDEATTVTDYAHDALGRLTESTTGAYVATYGWDAASNLVSETVSDNLATNMKNDGHTVVREVNAVNQLVSQVMDPAKLPASHTETTVFGYDPRGNRVSELTTTTSGKKTHVASDVAYAYDGQDFLTSSTGGDVDVAYTRDGAGRALAVAEDGDTRNRLYDGFAIVRDGDTAVTRTATGLALFESTSVTTGNGKKAQTVTQVADVLTDVLGSTVATATDGVIDADLALFGDFGEVLTEPGTQTVTGFTGHASVDGLLEFATRTYDVDARVWLQDDSYRGSLSRASSLNRYAYVEGAPETFVDRLGFFRAAAALYAQQVKAWEAARDAEVERRRRTAPACSGMGCMFVVEEIQRQQRIAAQPVHVRGYGYAQQVMAYQEYEREMAVYNDRTYELARMGFTRESHAEHIYQQKLAIHRQWESEQLQIQAELDSLVFYHTVEATIEVVSDPSFLAHTVLDVVGMIPVVGEAADLLNAGLYALEGDHVNAALSLAAMVPVAGAAVAVAKVGKNAIKAGTTALDSLRIGGDALKHATPPKPSASATKPPDAPSAPSTPGVKGADGPGAAPAAPAKSSDIEMGRKQPKPIEGNFETAPDSFLTSGAPVRHSETATAIGSDPAVAINLERSQGSVGHDVVVHGTHLSDGTPSFVVDGMPTNTNQIAEAILDNPNYKPGTPIQLVTCHGACGLADELGEALGGVGTVSREGKVLLDEATGVIRPPVS